MGFDWHVSISLVYCIPIKLDENVSLWYVLKRLAEYEPGYAKRAHDAMVTGDPLGKALLKRAAQSVIVWNDSVEYCEDEIDKEAKNPTPIEERFHYNPRLGGCGEEREFELEYNEPDLLGEAFELAAARIIGDGHGVTLDLVHGGSHGEADAPAEHRTLFMSYKAFTMYPGGSVQVGRGAANVPWGVSTMTVPVAPPGVAEQMHRLMAAFGMNAEGEAAWRVITAADGG